MRRERGLALGLLAGLFVGCVTNKPEVSVSRRQPFQGPAGPDVVQMEMALIEQPAGDRFLNQDLWPLADEQVVGLEQKGVLEENGFHVAQIGGIPPPHLQELLTSTSSCANPRLCQMHSGKSKAILLGTTRPQCRFQLRDGGEPRSVSLEQALCTLVVVPTLLEDGRTRLQFTPQILHGESALLPCPAADGSGWVLQEQRPTETYPALGWEVVLGPNEFVVVGGRYEQPASLGHECFIDCDNPPPVQRLLVIRAGPPAGQPPGETSPEEGAFGKVAPLALQAGYSTVRGSSR
jgi:hypothetical protein